MAYYVYIKECLPIKYRILFGKCFIMLLFKDFGFRCIVRRHFEQRHFAAQIQETTEKRLADVLSIR